MIRFEIINDPAVFETMRDQWNKCLDQSHIKSMFLRWEWLYSWWEQYTEKLHDPQLSIVAGFREENLELIFPAYFETIKTATGKQRSLNFIGNRLESTDYLSVICEESKRNDYLPQLFQFLINGIKDVDRWEFINVLEDDSLLPALQQFATAQNFVQARHHHRICPYIAANGTWEDFVSGLSKNMRYNLRRRTRNLLEKQNAQFGMITESGQVQEAVARLFELHEQRWDTREGTSIFKKDLRLSFHQAASARFFESDILRLFFIRVEDKPSAMLYCFEYGGELMYFQAGFDPHYEKQSIGLVLMGKCIQYTFEHGLTRFDFMRGAEDYKFKWTQDVRNMDVLTIGVSARGKRTLRLEENLLAAKEGIKKAIPDETWDKMKRLLKGA